MDIGLNKMGILKIWEFADKKRCAHTMSLSELRNHITTESCRVAIDLNWIVYKYYSVQWKNAVESLKGINIQSLVSDTIGMIIGLDKTFKSNGIDTTWCLDGDKNPNKIATSQRQIKREKTLRIVAKRYKICQELLERFQKDESCLQPFSYIENFMHLLDDEASIVIKEKKLEDNLERMRIELAGTPVPLPNLIKSVCQAFKEKGIHHIRVASISEGEKLACVLIQLGYCQAVHSNDGDTLAHGARCIITELKEGKATVYSYSEVIRKSKMSHRQFLYFCVLCGTDFNTHIKGTGQINAEKKVRDSSFDIYKESKDNFGSLRVNRSVAELLINRKDCEDTLNELEKSINPSFLSQSSSVTSSPTDDVLLSKTSPVSENASSVDSLAIGNDE